MNSDTLNSVRRRALTLTIIFAIGTMISAIYLYWVHSIPLVEVRKEVLANYNHSLNYDYVAYLTPNEIYNRSMIDPKKELVYLRITKYLLFNVDYEFRTSVRGIGYINYTVRLILESPAGWKKELGILSNRTIEYDGVLATVRDYIKVYPNAYWEFIRTIESETGTKAKDYKMLLIFNIRTNVVTGVGTIDSEYNPKIGINLNKETSSGDVITVDHEDDTRNGEIARTFVTRRDYLKNQRYYSYILTALTGSGLAFFSALLFTGRTRCKSATELLKPLEDIIVDVSERPANMEDYVVVKVSSLGDLVKVSDALSKPILIVKEGVESGKLFLYVLDEKTLYKYEMAK